MDEVQFCPACGRKRESGHRFCSGCGRAFDGPSAAPTEVVPACAPRRKLPVLPLFSVWIVLLVGVGLFLRALPPGPPYRYSAALDRRGLDPLGVAGRLFASPTSTPTSTATPTSTSTPTPTATPITEAGIVARVAPSVVQVIAGDASGSGVRVAQGILTNAHVVDGYSVVQVVGRGGQTTSAAVVRVDTVRDLALLESVDSLPVVDIASAGPPHQGDPVLVLGYPLDGQPTVSRGIVSALWDDAELSRHEIQTDAAINPGNSGGPMLNARGELLGLVVARERNTQGIGFAIAADTLQDFLAGHVVTPPATPTPPPTATPVPWTYSGRASDANLTLVDLGPGWSLLPAPDEIKTCTGKGMSMCGYVFSIATTFVTSAVVVFPGQFVATNLASDPYGPGPDAGVLWRPVSAPNLGDRAWAWVGSDNESRYAEVEVAKANVRVTVEISGHSSNGWENVTNATNLAQIILSRMD